MRGNRRTILIAAVTAVFCGAALYTWVTRGWRTPPLPRTGRIPDVAYLLSIRVQSFDGLAEIQFDIEGPERFHSLVLDGDRARLAWSEAGYSWTLAEAPLPAFSCPADLKILRRRDRAVVTLGNRTLLCVRGLELGAQAPPRCPPGTGLFTGSARIQPLDEIYFSDDFMKEKPVGVWHPVTGAWEICSTSFAETSSNPFCLYARGPGSPKVEELYTDRIGRTYVGIGIQVTRGKSFPRVIRVTGNSPAARAGIKINDRILKVNGVSLHRVPFATTMNLLRGNGKEGTEVVLELQHKGSKEKRTMRLKRERLTWGRIDYRMRIKPYSVSKCALITAGHSFWDIFSFGASVKSRCRGAVGLVFHYRGPRDYLVLRWWGESTISERTRSLELVMVQDGRERIIARSQGLGGPVPHQYYRLRIDVGQDTVTARIDGKEFLKAKVDDLSFGAVGLYTIDSDGAYFDDVIVSSNASDLNARPNRELPEKMRKDKLMRSWAGDHALWVPQFRTGMRWHRNDFRGDVRVTITKFPQREFRIIIAGDGNRISRGYVARWDPSSNSFFLERNGELKASRKLTTGTPKPPIVFKRTGSLLSLVHAGTAILEWNDPTPLTMAKVGVDIPDSSAFYVSSPGYFDYTFTSAPVDWELGGGLWGMVNRWVCDPRWSWFGGKGRSLVVAWNNHLFHGDVSLDAYLGLMMTRNKPPLERQGDIGLTICGDGKDVFSGYTFLFGGGGNSWTRLYRNGKKVCTTSNADYIFPQKVRRTVDITHRRWFHLRILKHRQTIECWFNGRPIPELRFHDPAPIKSGRVAIWTVNNGILLGRVRINAQARPGYHVPIRSYLRFENQPISNWVNGEISAEVHKLPGDVFQVCNIRAGGPFAIQLIPSTPGKNITGTLRMECRFDPDVKVDVYITGTLNTARYILTGDPDARCVTRTGLEPRKLKCFGTPSELKPGQWHKVVMDMDEIRRLTGEIQHVTIGNYMSKDYLAAGRSGNRLGSCYYLRNLLFSPFNKSAPNSRSLEED